MLKGCGVPDCILGNCCCSCLDPSGLRALHVMRVRIVIALGVILRRLRFVENHCEEGLPTRVPVLAPSQVTGAVVMQILENRQVLLIHRLANKATRYWLQDSKGWDASPVTSPRAPGDSATPLREGLCVPHLQESVDTLEVERFFWKVSGLWKGIAWTRTPWICPCPCAKPRPRGLSLIHI